ncbi:MAG: DMT family transporter [Candidatus Liptonbacteria bacterium]|nr:DMT family transporter [Candidatus Liptonbacteria bacterium]
MSLAGLLYAIGAAVTWGSVYALDQRILRDASPFTLLFVGSLITAILLLPIAFFQRSSLTPIFSVSGKVWTLIILSLLLAALANFFIFSSIKLLDASTASIFEIAYPFFVVLFSMVIFGTAPSWYFLIGALLIFAGAALIIGTS